jgi:ribose transport system permease protein
LKKILSIPEAGIFLLCIVLILLFQLVNPLFFSLANIQSMLRTMSYAGIVSIGLAICLISGTIDLSVGGVVGLSSVVFAKLLQANMGLVPAIAITLCIGIIAGLLNSFVIVKMKVTPFIATLSTMYIFRGMASFISNGFNIYPLSKSALAIGGAMPLGVSWSFITMIAIMIFFAIMLHSSVWGLCLRAVGSDEETAFNTEVNVTWIKTSALLITGVLSAVAGILTSMMLGAGIPSLGTGWELIAITACAIGGVSLFGYTGNMAGLFLGLFALQIIQNGIIVIGISAYIQNVVVGGILMLAMIVEVRRRRTLNLERV